MIKIDVWSDFVCPFCYIGATRLQKVLNETGIKHEVVYNSFELDPTVKSGASLDMVKYIKGKRGATDEQAKEILDSISASFEQEGLVYNYNKSIMANTKLAHQLVFFAREQDKENGTKIEPELRRVLFKSHFEDGLNIGDINVLAKLAEDVGLKAEDAKKALEEERYSEKLYEDKMRSKMYGITSVPQFIINDKYKIVGAQSNEYFKEALIQINKEFSKNITTLPGQEDGACGDDGCAV